MMTIYNIEFRYPYFFLLLILLPFFFYLESKRSKAGIFFANLELLKQVFSVSSVWRYLELALKTIIYTLFVIILANPGYTDIYYEDSKKGIDISIVLDISNSMLAEDISPNRIEAAKTVISDFIDKLKTDRVSFVLFAGKPFVSIPLTFDYLSIRTFIKEISTNSINQNMPGLSGTAIGDALITSADSLYNKGNEDREKVIVLVTDGEANVGIDPKISVKYVNDKKIKIYSIGIGKKEGTDLFVTDSFGNKQYFTDSTGVPIKAKLDEDMLIYLSDITSGKYFNAQSTDSLKMIFEELSKLNKKEIKVKSFKTFLPIYSYFLILILISANLLVLIKIKHGPKI